MPLIAVNSTLGTAVLALIHAASTTTGATATAVAPTIFIVTTPSTVGLLVPKGQHILRILGLWNLRVSTVDSKGGDHLTTVRELILLFGLQAIILVDSSTLDLPGKPV